MDHESNRQKYKPLAWRDDDAFQDVDATLCPPAIFPALHRNESDPNIQDQCRLLDLLGRINYKILSGNRVYVEVGGVVYKTLYGGYWRSVFTGIEHYLLRCEQVSGAVWSESSSETGAVDLPIAYSTDGWTASGHSLSFMLNRD